MQRSTINHLAGHWLLVLMLLGQLWPVAAGAAETLCPFEDITQAQKPQEREKRLRQLLQPACIADKVRDPSPLVMKVHNALSEDSSVFKVAGIGKGLDLLIEDARGRVESAPASTQAWWQAQLKGLLTLQQELGALSSVDTSREQQALLRKSWATQQGWTLPPNADEPSQVWQGVPLNILSVKESCNQVEAACPAAGDQVALLRQAKLIQQMQKNLVVGDARALADQIDLRLGRWKTYREVAPHQTIWELWLNGIVMKRFSDDCSRNKEGVQLGFCSVPESQWIVLHPDVGVRASRSAKTSTELKPAFIIEGLGYALWKFQDGGTAMKRPPFSVSLAGVYSEQSAGGSRNWSYGPMLRYNGYNLALTRNPDRRWGITVSVNLAERYFDRRNQVTEKLKSVKEASLSDLLSE